MSYHEVHGQIETMKNGGWKLKKGKFKLPDSPFPVGIEFEYLKD